MMKKSLIFLIIFVVLAVFLTFYLLHLKQPLYNNKNMIKVKVSSLNFLEGQNIPEKYTCDGQNINPSILIDGVPKKAKSLALIVDDPDAPSGTFTHWILFNIAPDTREIGEDNIPKGTLIFEQRSALLGENDFGKLEYSGPCPPSGTHRYYFKVFALDHTLQFDKTPNRKEVDSAMEGHIIGSGQLMGTYSH